MTNYEKIKQMSVEEIVALFDRISVEGCAYCSVGDSSACDYNCAKHTTEWLKKEAG